MDTEQKQKIQALNRCTFLPASYPKRFVRDIYSMSQSEPDKELSEKQAAYLDKLYYMYRRQIGVFWNEDMPPLVKPGCPVQMELPMGEKRYENIFGLLVEVE